GPAVVGNIGAPGRINYTLIGDTVNAAQRLEALGKAYIEADASFIVLISGETKAALNAGTETAGLATTYLGDEVLRGRESETAVYRLDQAESGS
ncbi:MAG TPA: adenylate/guanylate cyclase domain-containing protein, partial [Kiloniellaceae bacterium]|nr:adenylate/guanylate cyclase domain-containing protein [Kiloniellaceae bacterium]